MRTASGASLAESISINDPDFLTRSDLHPLLERVRTEAPVLWCEDPGVWLVSKYQDIRSISQQPGLFTSSRGITLNDAKYKDNIAGNLSAEFVPEGAEPLMTTDPPRHRELRTMVSRRFNPKSVASMDAAIRAQANALLDTLPDGQVDIVGHLGAQLSMWTITQLLGVPQEREADFRYWTDEMFRMGGDLTREELLETAANVAPMYDCLSEAMALKAEQPRDDVLTLLVQAVGDEAISPLNASMLASTFLVAGHETTRSSIGAMCVLLDANRAQFERLKQDHSLAGGVIDEVLRVQPVVPGFMRTATADTELSGQAIAAGEAVYMFYVSGNRDAEVFPNPHSFDIMRKNPSSHLAFGVGEHYCPGAGLARLQIRILLEEMLRRFSDFKVVGTPVRTRSTLENAWKQVPLMFS